MGYKAKPKIDRVKELRAVILTHAKIEGPGLLEDILRREGVSYRIIDATTQEIPETYPKRGILIPVGGPMSVNDDYGWLRKEIEVLRQHVEVGRYLFATGLGSQLLAKVIGGEVEPAGIREVGSYEVELTLAGKLDKLFINVSGRTGQLKVLHWHSETYRNLPQEAVVLATGNGLNQAFRYKNAYGLQFHWEATEEMVKQWIDADPDYLKGVPTTREKVLREFNDNSNYYRQALSTIFGIFLDLAKTKAGKQF